MITQSHRVNGKRRGQADPMTAEQLDYFRAASEIVRFQEDRNGSAYNNIGVLNQAAWIGERAHFLIWEIERLRPELALPVSKPQSRPVASRRKKK
jgi:hypothetical protein